MIDGVLLGAVVFGGGIACGLAIAYYHQVRQDARDNSWAQIVTQQQAQIVTQQQAQIDDLVEYAKGLNDDDEVSAEELGYE